MTATKIRLWTVEEYIDREDLYKRFPKAAMPKPTKANAAEGSTFGVRPSELGSL